MLITYILFIPFFIPLIFLTILSVRFQPSEIEEKLAIRLKGKGIYIWIGLAALGRLAGDLFLGTTGMLLTLLLPNLVFLISYFPFFLGPRSSKKSILGEAVFSVVAILIFWSGSVGPHNWQASGLAFIVIFPALFVMSFITTLILLFKKVANIPFDDESNLNQARFTYKWAILAGLGLLFLFLGKKEYFYNFDSKEVSPKILLACRVGNLLRNNRIVNTQGAEVVSNKLFDEIYKIENQHPKNHYGGSVEISEKDNWIYISLSEIPKGNPCFQTIFINSIHTYGFESAFVEDKSISKNNGSMEVHDKIKEICSLGPEKLTITFAGQKAKIIEKTGLHCGMPHAPIF